LDPLYPRSFPTRRSSDLFGSGKTPRSAAEPRPIVVFAPAGAEQPLVLGLAGSEVVGDLDLVEAAAPRHRILVGKHMAAGAEPPRSEEHTSELQSRENLVC